MKPPVQLPIASSVLLWLGISLLLPASRCWAQPVRAEAPTLDRASHDGIVEELASSLRGLYVFADQADAMAEAIESSHREAGYAAIPDAEQLAAKLTRDLRSVTDDKHLRVFVLPPEAQRSDEDLKEARRRYEERAWRENFGFRLVQILEGNVGYLKLDKFADPAVAGDTAAAAMALLARSEALIIDLRENQGGSPFMVQLLASYLLPEAPQHLVDQVVRSAEATRQIHSLSWVPGQRMPEIDVFVLTASETFSAAEGFTYMLQSMERAKVVGERTAGGAHPVRVVKLGHGLAASIPFARAVNPITLTNWEGVGITPDVNVPAAEAFGVAYAEALKALIASSAEDTRRAELEGILSGRGQ
ncbi:MAG: S41 family peptidase [Acidobacteriota bacterium]